MYRISGTTAWLGAALPITLLALPVVGERRAAAHETSAVLAGMTASALVAATLTNAAPDTRALLAVALLVAAVYAQMAEGGGWLRRCRLAAGALAYPGLLAFGSVAADTQRFANVDFVLALAAAGVAAAWPLSRDGAAAVAASGRLGGRARDEGSRSRSGHRLGRRAD